MNRPDRTLRVASTLLLSWVALSPTAGCSLLVSGNDGLTPDLGADAGASDAGASDAASPRDAGTADTGAADAGASDAGQDVDGGPADGGCATTCGGVCTDTQTDPLHCGSCATSCSVPDHGFATCADGACGFACDPGYYAVVGTCEPRLAPRPIAPLSSATATSRRPTFRWELAPSTDGARIEVCADRACTSVLQTIDASGASGRPAADLPVGIVFWRLFGRSGSVVGVEPSVTWQLHIGARTAPVDTSWGTTLDVNGDGYSDLLIGAQGNGLTEAGAAYLYFGSAAGLSSTPVALDNPLDQPGLFGCSVASAGDVNGDGYTDLVVSAHRQDNPEVDEGSAYLFFGAADFETAPTARTPVELDNPLDQASGRFGSSIASAGDLNGDGYAELVVGAFRQDNPEVDEGSAYVYFGTAEFRTDPTARTPIELDNPLDQAGGFFGYLLASAGDMNGDGFADLVVGAMAQDSPEADAGSGFVYFGAADFATDATARVPIELSNPLNQPGGAFGHSVATADDLNGDGYADLIVGARYQDNPEDNEGSVYVYFGASDFATDPSARTSIEFDNPLDDPFGNFGISVAGAGDLNGDGFADFVVGAAGQDNPETDEGSAYVYFGAVDFATNPLARTAIELDNPLDQASGFFGWSVASAGDLNADGYADLVVGASQQSNPETNEGGAYIYFGASDFATDSATSTPDVELDNPLDQAGGFFGRSVARAGAI